MLPLPTSITRSVDDVHIGVVQSPINAAADASLGCPDPGILDQIYAYHEHMSFAEPN